jgi:hypothetical protein
MLKTMRWDDMRRWRRVGNRLCRTGEKKIGGSVVWKSETARWDIGRGRVGGKFGRYKFGTCNK